MESAEGTLRMLGNPDILQELEPQNPNKLQELEPQNPDKLQELEPRNPDILEPENYRI